mmetsp:Transcript_8865/g.7841  ORF Transcript_8865/g.7841 Transcript_8865/m.7841 type:complete len:97 (+) Transcript_8865:2-292(+)
MNGLIFYEGRSGIQLFCKSGTIAGIMPYYSMKVDEWFDILWRISAKSREFYKKNIILLSNMYKSKETDQYEIMISLIQKYVDPEIPLDRRFALFLN